MVQETPKRKKETMMTQTEINSIKPNRIFHSYHMGHSISALMAVGQHFFYLCSNFNRKYMRLVWVCTVCICPTKRNLDLQRTLYMVDVQLLILVPSHFMLLEILRGLFKYECK